MCAGFFKKLWDKIKRVAVKSWNGIKKGVNFVKDKILPHTEAISDVAISISPQHGQKVKQVLNKSEEVINRLTPILK